MTESYDGDNANDDNGGEELNPAQTSGNSPPDRSHKGFSSKTQQRIVSALLPYERKLREFEHDNRQMSRYIARSVPDENVRITLWDGDSELPPTIADVTPLWAEGDVEILIESNDPEVDLQVVYEYFRWRHMTLAERRRHLTYVPRSKQSHRPTSPPVPQWNSELRTLLFGGEIVKQFKQPAGHQVTVLAAFEEEHWPPRIDDPLYGPGEPKKRRNETIYELNQNHRTPGILRFRGDGTSQGIIWESLL